MHDMHPTPFHYRTETCGFLLVLKGEKRYNKRWYILPEKEGKGCFVM